MSKIFLNFTKLAFNHDKTGSKISRDKLFQHLSDVRAPGLTNVNFSGKNSNSFSIKKNSIASSFSSPNE